MKKFFSVFLSLCMLALGVGCSDGNDNSSSEQKQEIKNVILVIGDGMGQNHLLNALTYFDLDIPVFMEDQKGYINTDSLSGTTDSAAGGTALATGTRVYNGNVALKNGVALEQITTIAKKANMKTGVITTDTLNGATPAAFSAHAIDRDLSEVIMDTQARSNVDLLMGRYSESYIENLGLFRSKQYTVAQSKTELFENKTAEKLLGLIPDINSEYRAGYESDFQLKDMAKFAVEYLESDNGFFLMIEGAYIDKFSHNNQLMETMSETRSLIDTVDFLYEYAADGQTAIFITADHETGGLQKAPIKDNMSSSLFKSTGHMPTPVPLFVKNYDFDIQNFGYDKEDTPKNTVVFEACKAIIESKN